MGASQSLLLSMGGESLPVIPGQIAWFKADSITGLVLNDPISQWDDSSGNARHITGAGVARPLYIPNQINGFPAVRFDGVNDLMTAPTIAAKSAISFFAVVKSAGTANAALFQTGTTKTIRQGAVAGIWESFVSPTGFNIDNINTSAFQILRDHQMTGDSYAWTMSSVADGKWAGDIAEAIFYDTILSATDKNAVLDYLAAKYGISARNTPLTPAGVTSGGVDVWFDASAQTGFVDNDPIPTLVDSGPGVKNGTAVGTARATYQTNEINSLPVIRFDGTNDHFALPVMTARTAHTIVFVAKSASTTLNQILVGFDTGAAKGIASGYTDGAWQSYDTSFTTFGTISTTLFQVLSTRLGTSSAAAWFLGAFNSGGSPGGWWGGDLAEFAAFDAKISTPDLEMLIAGLKIKYLL